jgi:hypothetical protein
MPRLYTAEFENQTIAAASGDYDLFSVDAATDKPIEVIGISLEQMSELGDAAEEQLRLRVIRGHTTASSGGAAPTPRPVSPDDAAAGFTARTNDSTIASAGTAVNLMSRGWNIRAPFEWWAPYQGGGFWTSGSSLLVVRLMAAVADDIVGMSGTIWVNEYP